MDPTWFEAIAASSSEKITDITQPYLGFGSRNGKLFLKTSKAKCYLEPWLEPNQWKSARVMPIKMRSPTQVCKWLAQIKVIYVRFQHTNSSCIGPCVPASYYPWICNLEQIIATFWIIEHICAMYQNEIYLFWDWANVSNYLNKWSGLSTLHFPNIPKAVHYLRTSICGNKI